jgi:hypothetical protein
MTQAPWRIVVHRQAAKPKQRICYARETLEQVSRGATPYLGSARPPCHTCIVLDKHPACRQTHLPVFATEKLMANWLLIDLIITQNMANWLLIDLIITQNMANWLLIDLIIIQNMANWLLIDLIITQNMANWLLIDLIITQNYLFLKCSSTGY